MIGRTHGFVTYLRALFFDPASTVLREFPEELSKPGRSIAEADPVNHLDKLLERPAL